MLDWLLEGILAVVWWVWDLLEDVRGSGWVGWMDWVG